MIDLCGFPERLVVIRKQLGLTQGQMASKCGVGSASQFLYEKGDRLPGIAYFVELEKLGSDMTYILGLTSANTCTALVDKTIFVQLFLKVDMAMRDDSGTPLDPGKRAVKFYEELASNCGVKELKSG